ncbi:hypothetical protein, partial [Pseudomonas syringae group genomosp. 3]|uniref:hypothetical protein n=1 Tax=Pseudomonas syringae group genomosp. 3 TaxID=251701 RepID=UPI000A964537
HFFDFGVGSHHEVLAPEKNWEHSIKLQLLVGNVGFMRRLQRFRVVLLIFSLEKHKVPGSANSL